MTAHTHARNLLSDNLNEQLDAARLLTDSCVQKALDTVAEVAHRMATSGNLMTDAHMLAAALMYEKAADSLRAIASTSNNSSSYGQFTDINLARILVADQLTTLASKPFDMHIHLGHLRSPLSTNTELDKALDSSEKP